MPDIKIDDAHTVSVLTLTTKIDLAKVPAVTDEVMNKITAALRLCVKLTDIDLGANTFSQDTYAKLATALAAENLKTLKTLNLPANIDNTSIVKIADARGSRTHKITIAGVELTNEQIKAARANPTPAVTRNDAEPNPHGLTGVLLDDGVVLEVASATILNIPANVSDAKMSEIIDLLHERITSTNIDPNNHFSETTYEKLAAKLKQRPFDVNLPPTISDKNLIEIGIAVQKTDVKMQINGSAEEYSARLTAALAAEPAPAEQAPTAPAPSEPVVLEIARSMSTPMQFQLDPNSNNFDLSSIFGVLKPTLEQLRQALDSLNPQLERFIIKNANLPEGGAELIADKLKTLTSLKTLTLNNCKNHEGSILSREETSSLIDSVPTSVQKLNISEMTINGITAPNLAKKLGELTALTTVDLSDNPLDDEGMQIAFPAIGTTVVSIDIHNTLITAESQATISSHVATLTKLLTFNAKGNNLGDKGVTGIASSFNAAIGYVDFSKNKVEAAGIDGITTSFAALTSLQSFDLSDNKIGREGTAKYLAALPASTTSINLRDMDATADVVYDLTVIFPQLPNLTSVTLNLHGLKAAHLLHLEAAIAGTKVRISDGIPLSNTFEQLVAKAKVPAPEAPAANDETPGYPIKIKVTQGDEVRINATTEVLNLSRRTISDTEMQQIADALPNTINHIDAYNLNITEAGWNILAKKIPTLSAFQSVHIQDPVQNGTTGTQKGITSLLSVLPKTTSSVTISNADLKPADMAAVNSAVRQLTKLSTYNISNNLLGDAVHVALEHIHRNEEDKNTTLTDLNISGTGLTENDANDVGSKLQKFSGLRDINFSNNPKLGDKGVTVLLQGAPVTTCIVNMSKTGITKDGAAAITATINEVIKASEQTQSIGLGIIDVSGNNLGDEGVKPFLDLLNPAHPGFHHIDIKDTNYTDALVPTLVDKITNCESLRSINLSGTGLNDESLIALDDANRARIAGMGKGVKDFAVNVRVGIEYLETLAEEARQRKAGKGAGEPAEPAPAPAAVNPNTVMIELSDSGRLEIDKTAIHHEFKQIPPEDWKKITPHISKDTKSIQLTDCAITGEALPELSNTVAGLKLTTFRITRDTEVGAVAINNDIEPIISNLHDGLTTLTLSGVSLTPDNVKSLSKFKSLEDLEISNNTFASREIPALVGELVQLRRLNLNKAGITALQHDDLKAALEKLPKLDDLHIGNNEVITDSHFLADVPLGVSRLHVGNISFSHTAIVSLEGRISHQGNQPLTVIISSDSSLNYQDILRLNNAKPLWNNTTILFDGGERDFGKNVKHAKEEALRYLPLHQRPVLLAACTALVGILGTLLFSTLGTQRGGADSKQVQRTSALVAEQAGTKVGDVVLAEALEKKIITPRQAGKLKKEFEAGTQNINWDQFAAERINALKAAGNKDR